MQTVIDGALEKSTTMRLLGSTAVAPSFWAATQHSRPNGLSALADCRCSIMRRTAPFSV